MRSANFRFGGKVLFRGDDGDDWVFVEGLRVVPAGTPIYHFASLDEVSLVRHDSRWDPFGVRPFMTPAEYRVMGGAARFPMTYVPGATQVGAYQSATSYDPGDPVWAWEHGWRKAEVMEVKPSWVTVWYLDGFRRDNGWSTKSCHSVDVWPVICDYPTPVRKIKIEPEWLRKPEPDRPR